MKTIREEWQEFNAEVLPTYCNPIQRQEMRRAFYFGAKSMLHLVCQVAPAEVNESNGLIVLEMLSQELDHFITLVKEGKA